MNKTEVKSIVAAIIGMYPGHYKNFSQFEINTMIDSWNMCFEDYTYEQASQGLKIFFASDTKGFPPVPGQIIENIMQITHPDSEYPSEDHAWEMVWDAIYNGGFDYEQAFKKLPKIIQKVVASPSKLARWGYDEDFNEGVESSNFKRAYRSMIERERNEAKIPESVKEQIRISIERTKQIEEKEEL
jgi:hypothetical protein